VSTRWTRRDDPRTWTTIDNTPVDDDLSDEALGLLIRWIRRPPNVDLPSIRTMCEMDRRAGKTSTNGKTSRERSAKELERKGYIVRTRWRDERGHWHTQIEIGMTPVPAELRSDPDERKRTPKQAPDSHDTEARIPASGLTCDDDTKPQVAPKAGFQGPVSGVRKPGLYSSVHSVKSSSSARGGGVGPAEAGAPEDEEEVRPEQEPRRLTEAVPGPRAAEQRPEIVAFMEGLPGRMGPADVASLIGPVAEALAAGWSMPALREWLVARVDVKRVRSPAAVYRTHLTTNLPAAPPSLRPLLPQHVFCAECGARPVDANGDVCPRCSGTECTRPTCYAEADPGDPDGLCRPHAEQQATNARSSQRRAALAAG
jgi:hypothetical protein